MRKEQAEATRDQLLDVATRLFADRGYEGTSIEMVLSTAGVSRGALYHHFPSKLVLFEAVARRVQERVAREVLEGASAAPVPLEMIRAGARAWLALVRDPVVRQITLIDAPSVLGWEKWREIDAEHFLGTMTATIQQTVGDSISAERVDFLAHMLLAMLGEVAMVIARGDQSNEAVESASAMVDDMFERMLG